MNYSRLIDLVKKDKEVTTLYLFGSRVNGKNNKFSDFDFAILLSDDKKGESYYHKKQLFYSKEFGGILGSTKVDIVILNEVSPRIIHQVIKNGKLLYERNTSLRAGFEAKAFNQYLDSSYYYNIEYHSLLKRIRNNNFAKETVLIGR